MKPLIVLISAFMLGILILKIFTGKWNLVFSGNMAMFVMLCFTAMGHFMFTKGMTMMVPAFIPLKQELVFLTGVAEVLLGIALLFPKSRYIAGLALIILFIVMLPANINAALKHIDYEKASYDGSGVSYLWFRVPLQVLFIGWVFYFSIRK
jgi:uncharacterized membrane protein